MNSNSQPRRRVSDIVEKGVEGLYSFLSRLICTIWLLIISKHAIRELVADRHQARSNYIFPFTYAAIGIFLISIIASVAGNSVLDWIWFYDEIPQRIIARIGEGVSLITIAIGSIPAFIIMLGCAALVTRLINRKFARSVRALFVTCYAIGTQSYLIFIATVLFSIGQLTPVSTDQPVSALDILIRISAYAALALIAIIFTIALLSSAVIFIRAFPMRGKAAIRRTLNSSLFILLSFTVFFILPPAASLLPTLSDALSPAVRPEINLEPRMQVKKYEDGYALRLDFLTKNPGSKDLGFSSSDITVTVFHADTEFDLENPKATVIPFDLVLDVFELADQTGRAVAYNVVPAGGFAWRRVTTRVAKGPSTRQFESAMAAKNVCVQVSFSSNTDEISSQCVDADFISVEELK